MADCEIKPVIWHYSRLFFMLIRSIVKEMENKVNIISSR